MMTASAEEKKIIEEHFSRLAVMLEEDSLILAGPCMDEAFGIVVFTAADIDQARRVMEDDPVVRTGVMTAELHPFKLSLIRGGGV